MDSIARTERLPYSRNPCRDAGAAKHQTHRATAPARSTTQPTTPLRKRVLVQITTWLGFGPRSVGRSPLDAATASLDSAIAKDALRLFEHIATEPPPKPGTLAEALLRNAHVVSYLAALENKCTKSPDQTPTWTMTYQGIQSWLAQQPKDVQRRAHSRIDLFAADESLRSPGARAQQKTLHAFCTRIRDERMNGSPALISQMV